MVVTDCVSIELLCLSMQRHGAADYMNPLGIEQLAEPGDSNRIFSAVFRRIAQIISHGPPKVVAIEKNDIRDYGLEVCVETSSYCRLAGGRWSAYPNNHSLLGF